MPMQNYTVFPRLVGAPLSDPVAMWLLAVLYAVEALFVHSALLLEGVSFII